MFILPTEESILRILSAIQKNMHKYFLHNFICNSENFEIAYVSLDSTGRGCEDEITHVRNLLDETPLKDKEEEVGGAFRLRRRSGTCGKREGTKDWGGRASAAV